LTKLLAPSGEISAKPPTIEVLGLYFIYTVYAVLSMIGGAEILLLLSINGLHRKWYVERLTDI